MLRHVFLVLLLFTPPALASEPVQPESVWTVYNRVDIDVVDDYAIVQVIAEIGNRGPDPEFPFQVRVPADAMVSGLTVERDGEIWQGRIEDRDAAREEYDGQKQQENTAALIEKTRGTQVYAFLVNVAARESVVATLTYEMLLSADQDVYDVFVEAPVSGFGQDLGAQFSARVCHSDGVDAAWASAGWSDDDGECRFMHHEVGARRDDAATPWSIHYTLPPTADEGSLSTLVAGGQGYFAHRFRAPADAQQLPLDLVLVLDTSGSMGREAKMQQMQDAAKQVVSMLDDEDRLAIVPFSSTANPIWDGLAPADPEHRKEAIDAIDGMFAAGSTHLEDGIRDGFAAYEDCEVILSILCSDRSRIVVVLADGRPTVGVTDPQALRDIALEQNPDARVFSIAFGSDADWSLMSGLARDNGGAALLVPQGDGAEVDLRRFMAALTTPVLEDVEIDYDGEVQAFRNQAAVLFQGTELLVVGTFPATMERLSGTVTGTAHDGPREYTFSEAVGGGDGRLPRIVAFAQIQAYQAEIDAEGEHPAIVAALKGLALEFGFVTDYTSLVLATETDEPVRNYEPGARSEAAGDSMSAPSPSSAPGSGANYDRISHEADAPAEPTPEPSPDARNTPVPFWVLLVAIGVALRRR